MKEHIKQKSSSWAFDVDKIENWAFFKNAFSSEECKKIINIGIKNKLETGVTVGKTQTKVRNSKISWLYPNNDLDWVFRRITDITLDLNKRFFNFDLWGIQEGLQFTHYKEPSGKYGKHVDKYYGGLIRKLSVSIQLSDPKTYKGGELCLYTEENETTTLKDQGTLILFPSYVLHEVKQVTKGERFSLVTWITGKQFK